MFKLDENNQCGFAITKLLPITIFKRKREVSMEILNNSIVNINPDSKNKNREIFVVDIQFDACDDTKKKMYNEIFPCVFDPKSKVPVSNRSVYQLLRGDILKFKSSEKINATLLAKKRHPMFIDHIHFLITRGCWKVSKLHECDTFEQEPYKKEYILENQKARQAAVTRGDNVQANFWKFLNNANFGFDCRDNSQNKSLHLIYDKAQEVDFISKYGNYNSDNCFLNLDSQIENVNRLYDNVDKLDKNEKPYAEILKEKEIESIKDRFYRKKNKKGNGKWNEREKLLNFRNHLEEADTDKSYTFMQELEEECVNSVRAEACKKQTYVKVSTRYISSKLLINAKISLASFIYECIDTFCFLNVETSNLYVHNKIIKILPYLLMTDTNSASLEFIVIAEDTCDCGEREMRDVLIYIFLENNIHSRLDLSGEFFKQYGKRNELVQKQVGLYELENIEQGIICALCINPKEYFELYGIYYETNKKHKGVRKGAKGMDFDNYSSRILSMEEAEGGTRRFSKKQKQTRFQN